MKNRREKLLGGLELSCSTGAEIGPLHNPIVSKSEGQVIYVDHKDTESLRKAYAKDQGVNVSIIHVDAIWGAQTLKQAIEGYAKDKGDLGESLALDYVVASHVIEHVPDLVTWLQEIRSILKPDGTVRLAIPDRRFTFDYLRRPTELTSVLVAYLHRARIPNTHCILDFCLNEAAVDRVTAWQGQIDGVTLKRSHTFDGALNVARDALEHGNYHDVHCWVFTPASFAGLCRDLAAHGLLDFECTEFHDTAINEIEFFVHMRACDNAAAKARSWQAMAASAQSHHAD